MQSLKFFQQETRNIWKKFWIHCKVEVDTLITTSHVKGIGIGICILLFGIYYTFGIGWLLLLILLGVVSIIVALVFSFMGSALGIQDRVSVYRKSERKIRVTLTTSENRWNRIQNGEKSFLISTSKHSFDKDTTPAKNHVMEPSLFGLRQRSTNNDVDNTLIYNSSSLYAKTSLTPQEWSAVTSPGFSSRIVRTVEHDPPLREVNTPNGRSYNLSPFLTSPHRNLTLGEIPAGSKWKSSISASAPVRFSSAQSSNRNISMGFHRREDDIGRLFLRIAPIDKITANSSTPEVIENNVTQTNSSPGLGGTKSALITDKLSRLWSSTNNSGYEASTSASLITPTVTESHNRKRNRNSDQNSDSSPPLKTPATPSNFPLPTEDTKNIKRLKFLNPPEEPMSNSSLATVPLTNYHNTGDMSSESILEQMNQTEKRFLPDDDGSTVRPNVKRQKNNGTSPAPSTSRALQTPTTPTYRKRKVSPHHLTVLNEEETEAKEKAPRLCNCSDCYKEAAGISLLRKKSTIHPCSSTPTAAITSPIPILTTQTAKKRVTFPSQHSQKSVDVPDTVKRSKAAGKQEEKDMKELTQTVVIAEEKDLFLRTKENLSAVAVIYKEQYFADKKRKESRLCKILELNQNRTKEFSAVASNQPGSFIDTRESDQSQVEGSGSGGSLPSGSSISQPQQSAKPPTSSQPHSSSLEGSGNQLTSKVSSEYSLATSTTTTSVSGASELLPEKMTSKSVEQPIAFGFSVPKLAVTIAEGRSTPAASDSASTTTAPSLLPNSNIGEGAMSGLSSKFNLPSFSTTSALPPFSFGLSPPVSNTTLTPPTTTKTVSSFQAAAKMSTAPSTTATQVQFGTGTTPAVTTTSSSSTLSSSFQFGTTTTANTQAGSDVRSQSSTLFGGSPQSNSSPASSPFKFGAISASNTQQHNSSFGGINSNSTQQAPLLSLSSAGNTPAERGQQQLFNLSVASTQPAITTLSKETTTISVIADSPSKMPTRTSTFPAAATTLPSKLSLPSFSTSSIPSFNFGSSQQSPITNSILSSATITTSAPFQTSTQNSPATTTSAIQFGIGSGISSSVPKPLFQFGAITTANTQSQGSGFGGLGSQQSTMFSGTVTTASSFGRPTTTSTAFGTPYSSSFGTPTTTAPSSPFGAANPSSVFGIKTTTTLTPFGTGSISTGFGAATTTSSTTFGVATPPTVFGTAPASSIFGTTPASSTFGTPAINSSTPFGTPTTNNSTPFGTATATPSTPFQFGTPALTNTQLQNSSFGGVPTVQATPSMLSLGGATTAAQSSPFQFGVTTTTTNSQLTNTGFGNLGTQPSSIFNSGITIPGSPFGTTTTPSTPFGTMTTTSLPFGTTTVTPSNRFQFGAAAVTNTQLQSPGFGGLGITQPQPSIFNLGGVSTQSSPFQFGATAPAQLQNPVFGDMGMSSPQSPMFTLGGATPTGSPSSAPRRNQARGRRYR